VVLWWAPTPAMRNPVTAALLVLLFALGFEGLRRKAAREHPSADRHELERHARERVAGAFRALRTRTTAGAGAVVQRAHAPGLGGNGTTAPDQRIEQLERLAHLHDTGALDDTEFRAEKARLFDRTGERVSQ
jgi:hypothetical protein